MIWKSNLPLEIGREKKVPNQGHIVIDTERDKEWEAYLIRDLVQKSSPAKISYKNHKNKWSNCDIANK